MNDDMARHECEMLAQEHAKPQSDDSETTRGMLKQIDGNDLSLPDGDCGCDQDPTTSLLSRLTDLTNNIAPEFPNWGTLCFCF